MGQENIYAFIELEPVAAQILLSLFHVLGTFILFAIFVALITSKFTTHYSMCVAEASLLQASVVLQLEKNLSKKQKSKLATYYKRNCCPLVSHSFFSYFGSSVASPQTFRTENQNCIVKG